MVPHSGNEVAGYLTATYKQMEVGGDAWVKPEPTTNLVMFQVVAEAARAMQTLGRIQILEVQEGDDGGLPLVEAIRIRRLR